MARLGIGGGRIISGWVQMRVKRAALRSIHALAFKEKRSDQSMLNVLVAEALRRRGVDQDVEL